MLHLRSKVRYVTYTTAQCITNQTKPSDFESPKHNIAEDHLNNSLLLANAPSQVCSFFVLDFAFRMSSPSNASNVETSTGILV